MNKDKIIKDLKERNNKLENQRRQFELNYYHEQHIVEKQDKEIERLNNINDELYNLFCQLDSEIMKRNYAKANKINFIIRNKLKELKGSDKK